MTIKKHLKNKSLVTKVILNKGFSGKLKVNASNKINN
jgi:hypothetical protein